MNIGVDFDGVIADTALLKIPYVKEHFNIKIGIKDSSREKLSKVIGVDRYNKMILRTYTSDTMITVPAVTNSLNALKKLSKDNKIFVVTSRTDKEMIAARKWLKDHNVKYDVLINTSNKSKTRACERYDINVLIEDESVKLEEILYPNTRKILLQRPYNIGKKMNKDITVCRDWTSVLKVLM